MPSAYDPLLASGLGDSLAQTLQIGALAYFGILWLFLIIWVTRDAIDRSESLAFQTFAILLNIAMPVLGALAYLILRPRQTNAERFRQDLELQILIRKAEGLGILSPEEKSSAPKKKILSSSKKSPSE